MKRHEDKILKGFTLIELLIAISFISIVIILSVNMIIFGNNTHKSTLKEYQIQSQVRHATEEATQIVRYSKAVFGVPYTFIESTNKMDPGWAYFMVSSDGKRIVSMEYDIDIGRHIEKVIVEENENIRYEMIFEKDKTASTDNVMKYSIVAYQVDDNENVIREKIVFESTVESVNAIQVADKGTDAAPSIALAYRNDGQTSGKGKNQIAYITIIIDVSGSMNQTPKGEGDVRTENINARIRFVREALTGTNENPEKGIIQRFSKEENIFISLVPFSTTANYPSVTSNQDPSLRHPIYEVFDEGSKNTLVQQSKALKAEGGTNTGDALRQAYHLHNDFRMRRNVREEDQVHHYTILLIDGETTFQTRLQEWEDNGRYEDRSSWSWSWSDLRLIRINYKVWIPKAKKIDDLMDYTGKTDIDPGIRSFSYNYPNTSVPSSPIEGDWYGEENPNRTIVGLTGNGNSVIKNASTIDTIGNMIRNFDSGNSIKSYLIAYASGLTSEINYIGNSIGTESDKIYNYDDPDFDLEDIFRNIANDIMADFWLATGPQIQ